MAREEMNHGMRQKIVLVSKKSQMVKLAESVRTMPTRKDLDAIPERDFG